MADLMTMTLSTMNEIDDGFTDKHNRPFRNLEKGTEESAADPDRHGNSRKSGGSPLRFGDNRTPCVSVASHCKLELFSIYFHFSIAARYLFSLVSFVLLFYHCKVPLP